MLILQRLRTANRMSEYVAEPRRKIEHFRWKKKKRNGTANPDNKTVALRLLDDYPVYNLKPRLRTGAERRSQRGEGESAHRVKQAGGNEVSRAFSRRPAGRRAARGRREVLAGFRHLAG
jgi:hypothetical protein